MKVGGKVATRCPSRQVTAETPREIATLCSPPEGGTSETDRMAVKVSFHLKLSLALSWQKDEQA